MTRALVTGGAGFIGSHVVDLLLNEGMDVTVLDDLSTGRREHVAAGATFVAGSVLDVELLPELVSGHDYIFHLAALPRIQPSFDDPVEHELVNVVGTLNVIVAARHADGLKKVVVSASSSCYGTPDTYPTPETAPVRCLSPYAVQKFAAEQQALVIGDRDKTPVIALRYFNVYGPRSFNPESPFNAYSSVIGIFAHQRKSRQAITVTGDGSQERDFVHVSDVARANLAAARSEVANEVYNVGTGRTISIIELARCFGGAIEHVAEREGEAAITWADIAKIQRDLGWSPLVDLDAGLQAS